MSEDFDAGVTHALALLGEAFRVHPITIKDGTEDYDGDVLATIDGIIRESVGDDAADELLNRIRQRPELPEIL
jgi:hypothetical protein